MRLGKPQPVGEVLVAATADAQGKWDAALASAPFAFTPAAGNPIPPREAASQTVHDLLDAYMKGGDTRAFLSADLRARMGAGEQPDQVLDLLPAALHNQSVRVLWSDEQKAYVLG